jgi:hypothetical protein
MDKILQEISVMILGELIRSPRYREIDMCDSDVAHDAVCWAKLLLKELNEK